MQRVLLVDDDEGVRRATAIVLQTRGYQVATAADGPAGVEAVRQEPFDVAIVDLFMPGMDGLATIAAIHAVCPALPIVAASGFMFGGAVPTPTMPNFDAMAHEAGAAATVYKPFRPATLFEAIDRALATRDAAAST